MTKRHSLSMNSHCFTNKKKDNLMKSVYVISTYLMFGRGLQQLLEEKDHNLEIVGQEKDLDKAVEQVIKLQPDIIILYSHNPLKTGASLAQRLLEEGAGVYLISMSVNDNTLYTCQINQKHVRGINDLVETIQHDFIVN